MLVLVAFVCGLRMIQVVKGCGPEALVFEVVGVGGVVAVSGNEVRWEIVSFAHWSVHLVHKQHRAAILWQ